MQDAIHFEQRLGSLTKLPLEDLRRQWAIEWGVLPHARIGRLMLEKSLAFKLKQKEGRGFTPEQQARLDFLVKSYRRNAKSFDQGPLGLKPGTKLIRAFKGNQHIVMVKANGFEYAGKLYTSLSAIASQIAGTRWNGKLFFGLKGNKNETTE